MQRGIQGQTGKRGGTASSITEDQKTSSVHRTNTATATHPTISNSENGLQAVVLNLYCIQLCASHHPNYGMTATRRVAVGRPSVEAQSRWTKWHLRSTRASVREWAHVLCLTSPHAVAAQLGAIAAEDLSPNEEVLISYGPPAQSYKGQSGIKHAQVGRSMASASSSRPRDAYLELQSDENNNRPGQRHIPQKGRKGRQLGGLLKMQELYQSPGYIPPTCSPSGTKAHWCRLLHERERHPNTGGGAETSERASTRVQDSRKGGTGFRSNILAKCTNAPPQPRFTNRDCALAPVPVLGAERESRVARDRE
ncbi:hypothetical protein BC826DRAFT_970873 [Russula brevipes]|nr:hypothetical protein BC826DRAFT_970873 [Russula brevipes]